MEFRFEKADRLKAHFQTRLGQLKRVPRPPWDAPDTVDAAVLALFGLNQDQEISVLITRRTDQVEKHKGQMAFPGGHCEPADFAEKGPITTALRETHEEVGIPPEVVSIILQIDPFSTSTGFKLHPVIGVLDRPIEEVSLKMDPHETAEAFWISLKTLTSVYRLESAEYFGRQIPIHVYQVGPHRIWGATGAILFHVIRAAFSS